MEKPTLRIEDKLFIYGINDTLYFNVPDDDIDVDEDEIGISLSQEEARKMIAFLKYYYEI